MHAVRYFMEILRTARLDALKGQDSVITVSFGNTRSEVVTICGTLRVDWMYDNVTICMLWLNDEVRWI